jgi:hypothetical protein
MKGRQFFVHCRYVIAYITVWIFNAILKMNENAVSGAHHTSFRMGEMRKHRGKAINI